MLVDNNFEDVFNAIFVYVNKDVANDVEDARDIFEIAFNNKACFVKDACDVANKDVINVCKIVFDDKDCFVKIVLTNSVKDACEIAFDSKDNFVNNVKDVSILIIINRDYVELDFFSWCDALEYAYIA